MCELEASGIKTLTYVNPFLCNIDGKINGTNLFKHAEKHGFLVKNKKNESYMLFLTLPTVKMGMIDVSNPAAVDWSQRFRPPKSCPHALPLPTRTSGSAARCGLQPSYSLFRC